MDQGETPIKECNLLNIIVNSNIYFYKVINFKKINKVDILWWWMAKLKSFLIAIATGLTL